MSLRKESPADGLSQVCKVAPVIQDGLGGHVLSLKYVGAKTFAVCEWCGEECELQRAARGSVLHAVRRTPAMTRGNQSAGQPRRGPAAPPERN